ncbi:MAG: LytTR family DNA-binding domain-containing protein [bacterium]|nr:LytTR family DNA-binding domain-containing protein [bacterium]MCM1374563.1 LytTR family DNA-binding domain-containing protein [Muribaculum sp.]
MKLKIAICDDDADQRAYLADVTGLWAKRNRHLTELRQYADADAFLFDYCEEKDYDILLLDIEMPGMNGIELARAVRRESSAVQIIFITGYYEYFSDGFDVSALHYLIKPADEHKLCAVLDRAAENLSYRQRSVLLSTSEGDIKVSLADILYLEAQNVYVVVHTTRGNYRVRTALGKFSEQLDDTFFKVHRSFVVSLKYIRKITRADIAMTNGDTVPVSRGLYDTVHQALIRYL